MLGKLTLSAIPFDQPIIMGAGGVHGLVVLGILAGLTMTGRWKWLWTSG
jgi:cytochrome o ubiquinol oxidase subunit 1